MSFAPSTRIENHGPRSMRDGFVETCFDSINQRPLGGATP